MLGPPGPIGPTGLLGERGKKGSEGEKGESGIHGPKGEKGERGYTGFAGVKGNKGEPWLDKRTRVAFSVMRNSKLGPVTQDTPITFDVILNNVGDSFEQYSSHFVCKINGTYFFTSGFQIPFELSICIFSINLSLESFEMLTKI